MMQCFNYNIVPLPHPFMGKLNDTLSKDVRHNAAVRDCNMHSPTHKTAKLCYTIRMKKTLLAMLLIALPILLFASGESGEKMIQEHYNAIYEEKGMDVLKPTLHKHRLNFYGLVETGIDNKLLTQNDKGEFCYLDVTNIEKPKLEVITPGFPGVAGMLGSDAEHRVAWLARGRGVYMIDLDTLKTGHMIAGNMGKLDRVLMTDKERGIFIVITFSAEVNIIFAYELNTSKDFGEIMVTRVATFYTLGKNTIMWRQGHPNSKLQGWYITDSLFEGIVERKQKEGDHVGLEPGQVLLTKELTKQDIRGVADMFDKNLHTGKRLFYGWIREPKKIPVIVRWSEDLQEVEVHHILLQERNRDNLFFGGPYHIAGNGNWMKGTCTHLDLTGKNLDMEELIVYHLQDHYPQGMSMPISLGFTDSAPGAFLQHSELGSLYVEAPSFKKELRVYNLDEGVKLLENVQ